MMYNPPPLPETRGGSRSSATGTPASAQDHPSNPAVHASPASVHGAASSQPAAQSSTKDGRSAATQAQTPAASMLPPHAQSAGTGPAHNVNSSIAPSAGQASGENATNVATGAVPPVPSTTASAPAGATGAPGSVNHFQDNTLLYSSAYPSDFGTFDPLGGGGGGDGAGMLGAGAPGMDFLGEVGGIYDAINFPEGLLDFSGWSNFFGMDPNAPAGNGAGMPGGDAGLFPLQPQ